MHYRDIYEQHYKCSLLPGIEVHHIDGDRSNNDPSNLIAVTIEEHLEIHTRQEDWGAVQAIKMRMDNMEGIKEAASKAQRKRLERGVHNFQVMTKERRSEISKKTMQKRIASGRGAFIIDDYQSNGRKGGLAAKKNGAGIHDPKNRGGNFVRGTYWWTNVVTGERVREKESPGEDWRRGMTK